MRVNTLTLAAVAAAFGGQLSLAQFLAAPDASAFTNKTGYAGVNIRYKEVPAGICEQDPNVKSYSGYADVAENEHIFWWFFEARNVDPTQAPLTVWINGGPGSSSMIGLFQELGPCNVNASGVAVENPYSWSNISNMLFIDQPTQTGLSYSNPVPGYLDPATGDVITLPSTDCPDYAANLNCGTYSNPNISLTANSTPNAAPNMYKTLQGFFGVFPQYTAHDFFFTTESYGGHYAPIFNEYFLEQNTLNNSNTVPIVPTAIMIGNGWFDPRLQYQAYYNFTIDPGNTYVAPTVFYNSSVQSQIYNSLYGPGNCVDRLNDCYNTGRDDVCSTTDTFCLTFIELPFDNIAGRDEYDSRELYADAFPPEFYVDYLNTQAVQTAIGAFVNFTESSAAVGAAFGVTGDDSQDFEIGGIITDLVNQGIYVNLYDGDADFNCNWLGVQAFIDQLVTPPAAYASAGFANITGIPSTGPLTSDGTPAVPQDGMVGQVRQAANFAFTRIFESGHEVPFYQPAASLEMFRRVINGLDIATGTVNIYNTTMNYTTSGPSTSNYYEGNSTYQFADIPEDGSVIYDPGTGGPVNATDIGTNAGSSASSASASAKLRRRDRRTAREVMNQELRRKDEALLSSPPMISKRRAEGGQTKRIMDKPRRRRVGRRGGVGGAATMGKRSSTAPRMQTAMRR